MDLNYIQRNDLAWARDVLARTHSGPLETRQVRYSMETLTRLVDEYDRQEVARGEAWRAKSVRTTRSRSRVRLADIHADWQRRVHGQVFAPPEADARAKMIRRHNRGIWLDGLADIAHAEAAEADAHDSYIQAIEG